MGTLQHNLYLYIFVMAATTYLIRMLPIAFVKKEITSRFARSFLFYVPYVCLSAMTFPAILSATGSLISGFMGFLTALFMAYREKSMVQVAVVSCIAVFLTERILALL